MAYKFNPFTGKLDYYESAPAASSAWGDITGTLSDQADLQSVLDAKATPSDISTAIANLVDTAPSTLDTLNELAAALGDDPNFATTVTNSIATKVTANPGITGATKTKITYDAKGLVTAGADATTADIVDSSNKRYVTDAQLTVIGNTSGINTGDQNLSPYFNKSIDDTDDIIEGSTNLFFTDERAQDSVGSILTNTGRIVFDYDDVANTIIADIQAAPGSIVTSDSSGLRLDGDDNSPGNNKYYGTEASGVKGFYDLPSGSGGVTNSAGADVLTKSDGTNLIASDATDDGSTFTIGASGSVVALGNSGAMSGVTLDAGSSISTLGDVFSNGNRTRIKINDTDQTITNIGNTFSIKDGSLTGASNGYVWTLVDQGTGEGAWQASDGGGGSGTVTSVSVVTANGISGSVATDTTTPAITLTFGAITPSSVVSSGAVKGSMIYGGDMSTVYSGYAGGVFGGSATHGVLDFVDNGSRIGEFYTTSSSFNFFSDTGSSINFYSNANYLGLPAFGIAGDSTHNITLSSLSTSLTAPTTSGTTKMVISDENGLLSFSSATVPTGTNTGDQDLSGLMVKSNNLSDLANASTARTNLGLGSLATQSGTFSGTSSGTNTGDQTIALTGDVTGTGTGSFAATIANSAVTLAKMANMATASLIYRKTAGSGAPEVNTLATLKTDLGLTGTNSGDQSSIVGITGTTAQFNTALTDNDFATLAGAETFTNKTLTSPVINTPTGIAKGDVELGNVDNTSNATERAATRTLTNARITKRTGTTTSSATPTINTDNVDFYSITALAAAITSFTTNLSGTPTEAQTLWIVITDNGTARAITWGASFEASTVALPTTTVISTRLDVGFVWNSVTSKWRCIAVA